MDNFSHTPKLKKNLFQILLTCALEFVCPELICHSKVQTSIQAQPVSNHYAQKKRITEISAIAGFKLCNSRAVSTRARLLLLNSYMSPSIMQIVRNCTQLCNHKFALPIDWDSIECGNAFVQVTATISRFLLGTPKPAPNPPASHHSRVSPANVRRAKFTAIGRKFAEIPFWCCAIRILHA